MRRVLQNITILLIVFAGLANLALSLPHDPRLLELLSLAYTRLSHHTIILHRSISAISGFALVFVAYRLYKRMQLAWIFTLIILAVNAVLEIFRFHSILNSMTLIEISLLVILCLGYRDFNRKSSRLSFKRSLMIAAISISLVVVYTSMGIFLNRHHFQGVLTAWDSLYQSIRLLFMMDPSAVQTTSAMGLTIARTGIILNWASLLTALVMVLKPLVFNPIQDKLTQSRVHDLVVRFGFSTISYLALEKDKKHFFGKEVEGVIAFDIVADVAICCGDLICQDQDAIFLLSEFMAFCRENNYAAAFMNVTDRYLPIYQAAGFAVVKYGEDAMFKLSDYSLAGGRIAKVRAAINHANKSGITLKEYRPTEKRDPEIEAEIEAISNEWIKTKKSGELAFMLGGTGLSNPMERRYFYTADSAGQLVAFVVFLPFDGGKGYMADVTRRRSDAPQGALEKIIVGAFLQMKDEGVEWGSMGLAPLARVREDPASGWVGRLFAFIYEHLNQLYGFKSLEHAKEKYAPTDWIPRYLIYNPPTFSARIAYAIVKVQNPKGVSDYLLTLLKKQGNG